MSDISPDKDNRQAQPLPLTRNGGLANGAVQPKLPEIPTDQLPVSIDKPLGEPRWQVILSLIVVGLLVLYYAWSIVAGIVSHR